MSQRSFVPPFALALLMLAPFPAASQGEASPETRPDHSVVFRIGGGSSIGYSLRMGERTDLSITGSFTIETGREDEEDPWSIGVGVGLKRYWTVESSVAPYTHAELFASRTELNGLSESRTAGLRGGVGLEWFPAERVSLGGHVGAEASFTRRPTFDFPPGEDGGDEVFRLGSLATGLRIQLYF